MTSAATIVGCSCLSSRMIGSAVLGVIVFRGIRISGLKVPATRDDDPRMELAPARNFGYARVCDGPLPHPDASYGR
jgi:hypothetical protein